MSEFKISQHLQEHYEEVFSEDAEFFYELGSHQKVQNILDISDGKEFHTAVEIGPGNGYILQGLSKTEFAKTYSAAEISSTAIEAIKKKKIAKLDDIQQFNGGLLPFPDKSFDVAICSHVVEHVEHPRILLKELQRIAHHQIIEIPIDFGLHVDKLYDHYLSYGHINIYTPPLFDFLLKSTGLTIERSFSRMYSDKVFEHIHAKSKTALWKALIKKQIWQRSKTLMRIKPNTYTVLTY